MAKKKPIATRKATPNAIYFVAERREPSGVANQKQREVPEGSRPVANNTSPNRARVDGPVSPIKNSVKYRRARALPLTTPARIGRE